MLTNMKVTDNQMIRSILLLRWALWVNFRNAEYNLSKGQFSIFRNIELELGLILYYFSQINQYDLVYNPGLKRW